MRSASPHVTRQMRCMSTRLIFVLLMGIADPTGAVDESPASVSACFTPGMDCQGLIKTQIDQTRPGHHIYVQAYSFTSSPLAQALLHAHQRGVQIRILLDRSQVTEQYSSATFFARAKIPLAIDAQEAIAHNKVMIFPERTLLLTGSYNFTRAAQDRNAENLLLVSGSVPLIQDYLENFTTHWRHSQPYHGH